jgi:hypothetical protein
MSTQSEIGQIQELLDMRVDLIARIQCLHHMRRNHSSESVTLIDVMDKLYSLTNDPKYKI